MFIRSPSVCGYKVRECARMFKVFAKLYDSVRDNVSHPSDSRSVYEHPNSSQKSAGIVLNNRYQECVVIYRQLNCNFIH